jgi:hypothetical protein
MEETKKLFDLKDIDPIDTQFYINKEGFVTVETDCSINKTNLTQEDMDSWYTKALSEFKRRIDLFNTHQCKKKEILEEIDKCKKKEIQ